MNDFGIQPTVLWMSKDLYEALKKWDDKRIATMKKTTKWHEWYESNRGYWNSYLREYRRKNADKVRATARAYYRKNRKKILSRARARRRK